KDVFYYYQSWWTDKMVLHLMPHWNWPGKEGRDIDVRCFSNCQEVELFLNGRSLGKKIMPRNSHLQWTVKYAPGVLSAKGYDNGKVVMETKVETTGQPAAVQLVPDRSTISADGEDLSIVTVFIADAKGRVVPTADNFVHFAISGPGKIIGVGNGNPISHEPDVCVPTPRQRMVPLEDWRMKVVPGTNDRPEVAASCRDDDWEKANVQSDSGPLKPGESGVFRTHVSLTENDLAATNVVLNFATIDDDGWVYVNGRFIGESHSWQVDPAFDVRRWCNPGDNTIAVVVKNGDGPGGLNHGVTLELQPAPVAATWKRSVFNGLAQVIVQSEKNAGEINLTASADGLSSHTITIHAKPCAAIPAVP
ncbi:MAG TPA: DUF4982 domain-containing protein, partial [Candidatus Binatia bacterium]|nr:DUF4982 domain-containing protein [Candidatus Binatia bacterium]